MAEKALPDSQVFGYIISTGGFTSNSYDPIELHLTSKGRYVGNVYDPDGTRVELDDE